MFDFFLIHSFPYLIFSAFNDSSIDTARSQGNPYFLTLDFTY